MYLWFFMFLSFVPLCQRRRTTESMLCSRACYMLMCCFHYFSLAPPRRRFIIVLHSSMFFPLTNSFECVAVTRETSTFGEGKPGIDNGSRRNIDETLMWWVKFYEKLLKLRNLMKSRNQINCKTFTNLNIFRLNRFIKNEIAEKWFHNENTRNMRIFFLRSTFWFAPPFVSILTSFQESSSKKRRTEGKNTQIWKGEERKNVDILFRWIHEERNLILLMWNCRGRMLAFTQSQCRCFSACVSVGGIFLHAPHTASLNE